MRGRKSGSTVLRGSTVKDVTEKNFGVIIAFLLPGFLLLWGLSYSRTDLASWLLNMSNKDAPLIGSFLYATIASLALGLVTSAVRMALFDEFLYCITRLKSPNINSAKLKNKETREAFNAAIENHYRYYQYYANSLIAIATAAGYYVFTKGLPSTIITILVIITIFILGYASRSELRSFNERAEAITG
jgi:hypothetical protein